MVVLIETILAVLVVLIIVVSILALSIKIVREYERGGSFLGWGVSWVLKVPHLKSGGPGGI